MRLTACSPHRQALAVVRCLRGPEFPWHPAGVVRRLLLERVEGRRRRASAGSARVPRQGRVVTPAGRGRPPGRPPSRPPGPPPPPGGGPAPGGPTPREGAPAAQVTAGLRGATARGRPRSPAGCTPADRPGGRRSRRRG